MDTRKSAANAVDAMLQKFWKDAVAPTDRDGNLLRRAEFNTLERRVSEAVTAYWRNTEGTR
jgi:hypothetical protein